MLFAERAEVDAELVKKKGAPNVIAALSGSAGIEEKVTQYVDEYVWRGIRCLGIARSDASG